MCRRADGDAHGDAPALHLEQSVVTCIASIARPTHTAVRVRMCAVICEKNIYSHQRCGSARCSTQAGLLLARVTRGVTAVAMRRANLSSP